jgi:hypothetical protein
MSDGSTIVYRIGAASPLFLQGELSRFAGSQFFGCPTAFGSPLTALLGRCINKQHMVAQGIPASLEQQCGVEDDCGYLAGAKVLQLSLHPSTNSRMAEAF